MIFAFGLLVGFTLGGLVVFVFREAHTFEVQRDLGRQIRMLIDTGNIDRLRKLGALLEGKDL